MPNPDTAPFRVLFIHDASDPTDRSAAEIWNDSVQVLSSASIDGIEHLLHTEIDALLVECRVHRTARLQLMQTLRNDHAGVQAVAWVEAGDEATREALEHGALTTVTSTDATLLELVVRKAATTTRRLRGTAATPASTSRARDLPTLRLCELERIAIRAAMQKHSDRKPAAAQELGIALKTLYNKLHRMAGETDGLSGPL